MQRVHRSLMALSAVALTALLAHTPAAAQGFPAPIDRLRFTTDFPFMVSSVTLPAGTYSVRRIGPSPMILELSNALTLKSMLLAVQPGNLPVHAPYDIGVTFERSGTAYVLWSLWDATNGAAVEAVRPRRAEPRDASATQSRPDQVLVRAGKR